jgi:cell division protein FtsQ
MTDESSLVTDATATDPVGAVDPRIRARRIAVQRDAGQKRLRRLVIFSGLVLLGLVAFLVIRSPFLDVDNIAVRGASRTGAGAVRDAAGIDGSTAMLDVDAGAVARRVEALPWVDNAVVERHFPGDVTIEITERTAAAVVTGKGSRALVDATGRVLERVDASPAALLTVAGRGELPAPGAVVSDAVRPALAVALRVAHELGASVRGVRVDHGELQLVLAGDGVARLGDDAMLGAKLAAVRAMLVQVDHACLAAIDVRVPTSPVLTRRQGCG